MHMFTALFNLLHGRFSVTTITPTVYCYFAWSFVLPTSILTSCLSLLLSFHKSALNYSILDLGHKCLDVRFWMLMFGLENSCSWSGQTTTTLSIYIWLKRLLWPLAVPHCPRSYHFHHWITSIWWENYHPHYSELVMVGFITLPELPSARETTAVLVQEVFQLDLRHLLC